MCSSSLSVLLHLDFSANILEHPCDIAGCLLLSSRQPGYFAPETLRLLISDYAHLLALAFEPEEFYSLETLDLRLMPSVEAQRTHFTHFHQRVLQVMKKSLYTSHPLTRGQAELLVWQQLEEELIDPRGTFYLRGLPQIR
jgi:hypothetical protein